jgi:hypothetical protein
VISWKEESNTAFPENLNRYRKRLKLVWNWNFPISYSSLRSVVNLPSNQLGYRVLLGETHPGLRRALPPENLTTTTNVLYFNIFEVMPSNNFE